MEFCVLHEKDLLEAGIFNYEKRIIEVEDAYVAHEEKKTISSKIALDIGFKWKFNSLVCVGEKYVLNKWLGANVANVEKNIPRSSNLIILNDKETGLPLCVMNGTLINLVRTGAVAAVVVKYLARESDEQAAVIGTGPVGQECVKCLSVIGVKRIKISSLDPKLKEIAEKLNQECSAEIIVADSIKDACKGSPIVVSATTTSKPIVKREWLEDGYTRVALGAHEDEDDVVLSADKIVNDDWEHVKKRNTQTVALLYSRKELLDNRVYNNIGEIIVGKVPGRESDEENIYFNGVGLGELDLFVAKTMFESSRKCSFVIV